MKTRQIYEIDLNANYQVVYRIPRYVVDRLKAEGIEKLSVHIDDVTLEMTIKPKIKTETENPENETLSKNGGKNGK